MAKFKTLPEVLSYTTGIPESALIRFCSALTPSPAVKTKHLRSLARLLEADPSQFVRWLVDQKYIVEGLDRPYFPSLSARKAGFFQPHRKSSRHFVFSPKGVATVAAEWVARA